MQLSSTISLNILLYLLTVCAILPVSAQQPTQPKDDLQPISATAVSETSTGLSSVTVVFMAADSQGYYQLICRIIFQSLMGPPQEYPSAYIQRPCINRERNVTIHMAIRNMEWFNDFAIDIKESPYEIIYGIESRTESPIWRLSMTGRLVKEQVDWATEYYHGYYWDMPRFALVGVE